MARLPNKAKRVPFPFGPPVPVPDAKRGGFESGRRLEDLPLWPEKVEGGKLIALLQRQVAGLRDETAHGNRELFLDDVFIVYLLAFYHPSIRTLRTFEDFRQTRQAQKHLSIDRIARSTLSDFNRVADPRRLEPIIASLRAALLRKSQGPLPGDLGRLLREVIAVDGTFLSAAASVAWAVGCRNQRATKRRHRARLDFHVDVASWLPEVVIPDPGESEADSAARTITPGAIHLYDRGFNRFDLMAAHYPPEMAPADAPGKRAPQPLADFVLRLRRGGNGCRFAVTEERPLTEAAQQAHVIADRIGHLPGGKKAGIDHVPLREVVLQLPDGTVIRLLTNLLELPAETIALLYRYRWQVELFFRWLKCYAHFDHLISHGREGVLVNFYVAVIGVLLLQLHTNGKPSKYMFLLLGLVANGSTTLEEILPILRERERQAALERASAARRRARPKPKTS